VCLAASSNQRTNHQFISPSEQHQQQQQQHTRPFISSSSSARRLFAEDSPSTVEYPRSVGPAPDYGHVHRMEAYRDASPRNMDVGMTSYPGHCCPGPSFNQYVDSITNYLLLLVVLSCAPSLAFVQAVQSAVVHSRTTR